MGLTGVVGIFRSFGVWLAKKNQSVLVNMFFVGVVVGIFFCEQIFLGFFLGFGFCKKFVLVIYF